MSAIFHHCIGCGSHRGLTGKLCVACADEFAELGRPCLLDLDGYSCLSLAEYSGIFRRLVLRAKVRGDHAALAWLEVWAMDRLTSAKRCGSGAMIIACPSSLWGRLRGRLDVAGNVCAVLAKERQMVLLPAPFHLFWRLSKRALAPGTKERAMIPSALPQCLNTSFASRWRERIGTQLGDGPLLLLDDVTTTGRTLVETAQAIEQLSGGIRPQLVALAAAPRLRSTI